MTDFKITSFPLTQQSVTKAGSTDPLLSNWPVVYTLHNSQEIYVGESLNLVARLRNHLDSDSKSTLTSVKAILDETYNKSACLDLESFLIKMFAGDGHLKVLNANDGVRDADYFQRETYQGMFKDVFEQLSEQGLFDQTFDEITNSDIFKLSPFKSLNADQSAAVQLILEAFIHDLKSHAAGTSFVQGNPGTGKTIIAIFLLKLISDIASSPFDDDLDADTPFAGYFTVENRSLLQGLRIGFVIPQQSLRESVKRVFQNTHGLDPEMVITAYDAGKSNERYDLLIVDEAHRLNQRANQSSGSLNIAFKEINLKLFNDDSPTHTQLDWILAQSDHQLLLFDPHQSVRPADIPLDQFAGHIEVAQSKGRFHTLESQMRVSSDQDFVSYVRDILSTTAPSPSYQEFTGYDVQLFESFPLLLEHIRLRDSEHGLSRVVAGYAWPWKSKKDSKAYDIELDGVQLRWNKTIVDWINSTSSVDEVGSIHTVQGYDLNYVGVIFGPDLTYDVEKQQFRFSRENYFDVKGMENNRKLGIQYSDEDILNYVLNVYFVLLTRGVKGAYMYAVDPGLREYLKQFFPSSDSPQAPMTGSSSSLV